jgi:hypothetical protein
MTKATKRLNKVKPFEKVNIRAKWQDLLNEAERHVDNVNKPAHYTGGKIECIEAITEAIKGLQGIEAKCTGDAIKYLWRWKNKNGIEDLKKAVWYINYLIKLNDAQSL